MANHVRISAQVARRGLLAIGVLLAAGGISCGEQITAPNRGALATIIPRPFLTARALRVADEMASFGLAIDNVRLELRRLNGQVAVDTTLQFAPGADSVAIELRVQLNGDEELFDAAVELREGNLIIFAGVQRIVARVGRNAATALTDSVALEYVGPGARAAAVRLETTDSSVRAGQQRQLAAVALDSIGLPIADARFRFAIVGGVNASVDSLGRFTAGTQRGEVLVSATIPSGPADTLALQIIPEPALLRLVSGGAQTAAAGAALPQPLLFEVVAADSLPVPGVALSFALTTGSGTLSTTSAATAANGRASVALTLGSDVGLRRVTATATGGFSAFADVTAIAAAPATISIDSQPAAAARAGISLDTVPRVLLLDRFGNRSATAGVAVLVALEDSSVNSLLGNRIATTDTEGVARFPGLGITGLIGTVRLRFTSGTLTGASSRTVTLTTGPPANLLLEGSTSLTLTAGDSIPAPSAFRVRDAGGNPVAGVSVTVARSGQGDTIVVTGIDGRVFLRPLWAARDAGSLSITGTVAGLSGSPLTLPIQVVAAAPSAIVFAVLPPTGATSGTLLSTAPVVQLVDAFANVAPVAAESVTVSLVAGPQTLAGTLSVLTDANGRAAFPNLTIFGPAGSVALRFNSPTRAPLTSSSIAVTAAAPTRLTITGAPSSVTAAAPFAVPVEARDAQGFRATSFTGNVTLSLAGGTGATLTGTLIRAAVAGVVDFTGLSIATAGASVRLVVTADGLTADTSAFFLVNAGVPDSLRAPSASSANVGAATALPVALSPRVVDAAGNPVAGAAVLVTRGGTGADTTLTTLSDGFLPITALVAPTLVGAYTFTFTASALPTQTRSVQVNVVPGIATRLLFTTQPSDVDPLQAFAVILGARDAFDNVATSFIGTVSLAFSATSPTATLSGLTSVEAVAGIAEFTGLSIGVSGSGFSIIASTSTSGVASDTSATFTVRTVGGTNFHDLRRSGEIAIYKNYDAFSGGGREVAILGDTPFKLSPGLGDFSVRTMSQLSTISPATSIAILPSPGTGGDVPIGDQQTLIAQQQAAATQLDTWVREGGWLVIHAADNLTAESFTVPGLSGSIARVFSCTGVAPAVSDHPLIRGPDVALGTADDTPSLTNAVGCQDNHGVLDGLLPGNAEVLLREAGGSQGAVYATYTLGAGRVIVTTLTLEYTLFPERTFINHLYWALNGLNASAANPTVRTANWIGGTGIWSNRASWDLGVVPSADDSVRITGAGTYTVSLEDDRRVGALSIGGVSGEQLLEITSTGTLTLDGDALLSGPGSVSIAGGSLLGNGDVIVGSELMWSSGTIGGTGTVLIGVGATSVWTGANRTLEGSRDVIVAGTLTHGTGDTGFWDDATVTVPPGGLLAFEGNGLWQSYSSGAVSATILGRAVKRGAADTTILVLPFYNEGQVDVEAGELWFGRAGFTHTHTGTFNVGAAQELRFFGGIHEVQGAVVGGRISVSTDSVAVTGSVTSSAVVAYSGAINFANSFSVSDSVRTSGGRVNFNTGATTAIPLLSMVGGRITGADSITIADSLFWQAGVIDGAGALTLLVGASGSVPMVGTGSSRVLGGGRRFRVLGQMRQVGGDITVNSGGLLSVESGGTYSFVAGSPDILWAGTFGSVVNNGSIIVNGGAGNATFITPPFENHGLLVQVASGTLQLRPPAGTYTHSSAFQVDPGAVLLSDGSVAAVTMNYQAPIRGGGAFVANRGNITLLDSLVLSHIGSRVQTDVVTTIAGPMTALDSLVVTQGTLRLQSATPLRRDAAFVRLAGSTTATITGKDTLFITDSLHWENGVMSDTTATILAPGAGAALVTAGARTVTHGRILDLRGIAYWDAGTLNVERGSRLRIASGGELNTAFPTTGFLQSNAAPRSFLENNGTLRRTAGTGVFGIQPDYLGSGSIEVQTGTMDFGQVGVSDSSFFDGPISIATGATFTLSGRARMVSSLISGGGTLRSFGATVRLQQRPTVRKLQASGAVNTGFFSSGTGTWEIDSLDLSGGTLLSHPDSIVIPSGGSLVSAAGGIRGAGTLLLSAGANANLGSIILSFGRRFVIDGAVDKEGAGSFGINDSSFVHIRPGGVLQFVGGPTTVSSTINAAMLNEGTITHTGAFTVNYTGAFTNNGTYNIAAGTVQLGVVHGALTFSHGGDFLVPAGATLQVTNGTHTFVGDITGAGRVWQSGGTATSTYAGIVSTSVRHQAGTATLSSRVPLIDTLAVTGGTFNITSDSVVTATTMIFGTTGGILGADTLRVTDSLAWNGGTMGGTGFVLDVIPGATATLSSSAKTIQSGSVLRLRGNTVHTSGSLSVLGSLEIPVGAVYELPTGSHTISGSGSASLLGTFRRAGFGSTTVSVPMLNQGVIDVVSGTLQITSIGSYAHTGSFSVASPGVLHFGGSGIHSISSPLTGNGTFGTAASSSGTIDINDTFAPRSIVMGGGTVRLNDNFDTVTPFDTIRVTGGGILRFEVAQPVPVRLVSLSFGNLFLADSLIVSDSMNWSSGFIAGAAKKVIAPGASLVMDGPGLKELISFGEFVVAGTGIMRDGLMDIDPGHALAVSNGGVFEITGDAAITGDTLRIDFGGTLRRTNTVAAPASTITAILLNQGLLEVLAGTLNLNASGAGLISAGDFTIASNATLNFAGTHEIDGDITGAGRLLLSGVGQVDVDGLISLSTIETSGGLLFHPDSFVVYTDSLVHRSTSSMRIGKPIVNQIGSRFVLAGPGQITPNLDSLGSLTNLGTFVRHTNSGTVQFRIPLYNEGLISIESGALTVTDTIRNRLGGIIRGGGVTNNALSFSATAVPDTLAGVFEPGFIPGTTGSFALNGLATVPSTATINIEIGGLFAGTQYDQITMNTAASMNAIINVTFINGFTPANNNFFDIVTFLAAPTGLLCSNVFAPPNTSCTVEGNILRLTYIDPGN